MNKKAYFLLKNSNGKRIIQLPWSIFKTEHERIEFLKTLEHYPNINLDYACQLILGKRNSVQDTLNIVKNLYSNYKKKNSKS
ncbi:hypothetical protein [Gracilibacillus thailandensis]|uniref:Uncharacterized protein n=1 Tax=Gracilibacillus thailandensis TaxID=563735 RepID=A0A6N7QY61_9BACI|nr:hypothetical protein [Gracilibacillus thailandensis]MRI66132.1 hypothetical protein [Gracilibacillus thailandensis]